VELFQPRDSSVKIGLVLASGELDDISSTVWLFTVVQRSSYVFVHFIYVCVVVAH